ncbi:MAG: DUF4157 domain-containing protein [Kofleriaceae bacterium]
MRQHISLREAAELELDAEWSTPRGAPGKRALTDRLRPGRGLGPGRAAQAELGSDASAPVQADGGFADPFGVHLIAADGVAGGGGALPHLEAIQRSFGHHDVSGVRAHVGGAAALAAEELGARAYATGDHVAFAFDPDLRLAAHEAAHVVQQRGGVRLDGGVGRAGDAYEQHADEVAALVVRGESAEALLDTMAHRGSSGGPAVQRDGEGGEGEDAALEVPEQINYVFMFAGGDAYGTAARAYIAANYPDYEVREADSLEQMFAILARELGGASRAGGRGGRGGGERSAGERGGRGGGDRAGRARGAGGRAGGRGAGPALPPHVGHIVLVSHASVSPPTAEEVREGAPTPGELYIAPTHGSDERVSAESLAHLQAEFRDGLHARFRRDRRAVVGASIDENTMIEIRGCRIAQSDETMSALRDLFGGSADVRAPTGYQGYGILPWDEARTPVPDAIEILIEQGSVPASSRSLPLEEQRRLVQSFVTEHGGLPTQHFIPDDGAGGHEAFNALSAEEATSELLEPGAGSYADRAHVDAPGVGGEWGYAADPEARDPELERLPREELERRARALLADYRPEHAPELVRLRNAWNQVTMLDDDLDADDPLAGIPPDEIFGDPAVIDRDAARVRRRHDRFEEHPIEFTEPTERQRDDLSDGPDSATIAPAPAAPVDADAVAAPAAPTPAPAPPVDATAPAAPASAAPADPATPDVAPERDPAAGAEPSGRAAPERDREAPARPAARRGARRPGSRTNGARAPERATPDNTADEAAASPRAGGELRIISHEGTELVFNRPAFRHEVVAYLWGTSFTPTAGELSGDDVVRDRQGELEVGTDRWMLPRTGFAARPGLYERMRPEARALLDAAPDLSASRGLTRPSWVPQDVWANFLAAGPGMHRYRDRSPLETDLILIRRDGRAAGYVEAQEREDVLYRQLSVEPPDRLQQLLGTTTINQHAVHLHALANARFNEYMWNAVEGGRDPLTALHEYPEAVRTTFLLGCVAAVGFMGSMAPTLSSP